jgi:hypothetical protein
MAEDNVTEIALAIAKAVTVLGILGLGWKIATWVIGIIIG